MMDVEMTGLVGICLWRFDVGMMELEVMVVLFVTASLRI